MRNLRWKALLVVLPLALVAGLCPGLAMAVEGDDSNASLVDLLAAGDAESALTTQATNNSKSNATTIPVNKATSDNLTSSSDTNWYKFTLPEDGPLELVFDSAKRDNSQQGWRIRLEEASGNWIWSGSFMCSSTQAASLATAGLPAGDYYVQVSSSSGWTSAQYTVTPKFTAATDWETELNDSKTSADSLGLNVARTGGLRASDDADWYKFTLAEDGPLELVFDSSKRDNSQQGWAVRLEDASGSWIWSGSFMCSSTQAASLATVGLPAGDYYILVSRSSSGWTSAQYTVTPKFTAATDWETELNDSKTSADSLGLNVARTGGLRASDDADWYKFTLAEDDPLELVFDSSKRDNSQQGWAVRLEDASGSFIWSGSFMCEASQTSDLVRTYLSAGDYYILVSKSSSGWTWTSAQYSVAAKTDFSEPEATELSMYRFYNPYTGEHFYTSDDSERDNLIDAGWTLEGDGWEAPASSELPVYRMYNSYAGEHHYTMSSDECDFLVDAGWTYEGIGWYSAGEDGTPLYRVYNPNMFSNNHFYTADIDERDYLVSLGWVDEGIGWYGA